MRFFLTRFTILLLLFSRPLLAAPSPDVSLLNVSTNVLKLKVKIPGKYAGKIGKIILQKLVTKNQYQKFGKKRLRPSSKKNTIHMKLTESLNYGVHYFRARVVAKGVGKSKWSDDLKVVKALILHPPEVIPEEPTPTPTPSWPELIPGQKECPAGLGAIVLQEVNSYRSAVGLAALTHHDALERSARRRVIDMAHSGDLTHGNWLMEIIEEFQGDLSLTRYAQNIARYFQDPVAVTAAWIDSPTHSQNILDPELSALGTACVIAEDGEYWWSQNFGGE